MNKVEHRRQRREAAAQRREARQQEERIARRGHDNRKWAAKQIATYAPSLAAK